MGADIAVTQGAENGIDERMQHRIRIGIACEPAIVRNLYTPQYQFSAAPKAVHVKTMADA
jgi:hypothetical protein